MYSSKDEDYAAVLLLIAILVTISTVVNGFVLIKLWNWFIIPTFDKMPTLSLVPAIGLGLVVSFLTYQEIDCQKKESNETLLKATINPLLIAIFRPLIVLLLGWILQLFM